MCGLAGLFNQGSILKQKSSVKSMIDKIQHRGPDDSGVWVDQDAGIELAHCRLSIIDPSPAGHQPMESASGRYVIVYNGEIYNHLALRESLASDGFFVEWKGRSDTETMLSCIEAWGIESALRRTVGMFAMAVWDKKRGELTLARDRIGEKPIYYGWQDEVFLFGSELKAIKAYSAFNASIDRDALHLYARYNYIPAPYTIYQGISKLMPGSMLTVSNSFDELKVRDYWSSECLKNKIFEGSPEEAVSSLESLLMSAVDQQMIADVPLGAFLSGGIDSSTIVALMQAQSNKKIKTFSIGVDEDLYNEAEHAKAVASHLGTDHTELYVSDKECMSVIPRLPVLYDEPFADSSQIPTFLVSQLARQHVAVSLSGDAGDELFAGYNRYAITAKTWGKISCLPLSLRRGTASMITSISPASWNRMANILKKIFPVFGDWVNVGDKLHKGASVITAQDVKDLYVRLVSQWQQPGSIVIGGKSSLLQRVDDMSLFNSLNDIERMMLVDLLTYLPDDILCKVDRAAMGVSLETRVPFLDHRVVEFAWQLPLEYKLRENQTKWVLKQVLYRYIPKELVERPKMGFGIPIGEWLRGPLREWAEELLCERRLRNEGYFNADPILKKWNEHLSGRRDWQHQLWNVLMFQAWLDAQ